MTHLEDVELLDAAEGRPSSSADAHLDVCESCRRIVGDLRADLRALAADQPALPPAAFWDELPAQVSRAIGADRRAHEPSIAERPSRAWRRRAWFGGLAAAAALVVVVALGVRDRSSNPTEAPNDPANPVASPTTRTGGEPADLDEAWDVLRAMAEDLDADEALEAGVIPVPGTVERAAMALTDDERTELMRLLQEEMKRTAS